MTAELKRCAGCGWDSAKRYEQELERLDSLGTPILTEALFGARPEHTCGRPTLDESLQAVSKAVADYQESRNGTPMDVRHARAALRHWLRCVLNDLELMS
jgi:hypothetical protein